MENKKIRVRIGYDIDEDWTIYTMSENAYKAIEWFIEMYADSVAIERLDNVEDVDLDF